MLFTVHFSVSMPFSLPDDQFVFVTGSHERLGNWDINRALRLTRNETGYWTGTINMGADTVKFRYFIGYHLQSEPGTEPILAIAKWETHLTPRCVMPPVEASKTGVCRANLNDIFGFSGGREHISDSFALTDEMHQITLTISGAALKFYKQSKVQQNYRLKVVPFDLRNKFDISNLEDEDDQMTEDEAQPPTLPSHSCTQIAVRPQQISPADVAGFITNYTIFLNLAGFNPLILLSPLLHLHLSLPPLLCLFLPLFVPLLVHFTDLLHWETIGTHRLAKTNFPSSGRGVFNQLRPSPRMNAPNSDIKMPLASCSIILWTITCSGHTLYQLKI